MKNLFQLGKRLMLTSIKMFWIVLSKRLTVFVLICATVNANFYKDVLDRLIKNINCVCPDLRTSRIWLLQHENHQPTMWHRLASFWPKTMLESFITLPIHWIWLQPIISYSRN